MEKSNSKPLALVIGLCSHGLAMTRALSDSGVEVHAFDANSKLPGAQTNSATVHLVKNIKTDSLIEDLVSFRKNISADRQIVLFPTNDNNVKVIANHIDELSRYFLISWTDCADSVLSLLLCFDKILQYVRCRRVQIRFHFKFFVLFVVLATV